MTEEKQRAERGGQAESWVDRERERSKLRHSDACDMCSFQAPSSSCSWTSCSARQLAQSLQPESRPRPGVLQERAFFCFLCTGCGELCVCQWVVCLVVVLCIRVETRGRVVLITQLCSAVEGRGSTLLISNALLGNLQCCMYLV